MALVEVKDSTKKETVVYKEYYDYSLNARRIENQNEAGAHMSENGTTLYAYDEARVYTFMEGMEHSIMGHTDPHCQVHDMSTSTVTSTEEGFGHEHIAHFNEMMELDHGPCFNHMGTTPVRGINAEWWVCDLTSLNHSLTGDDTANTVLALGGQQLPLSYSSP